MTRNRVKPWEMMILTVLFSVMIASFVIEAHADTTYTTFAPYSFSIPGGGAYRVSDPAIKTESSSQAKIAVSTYSNNTGAVLTGKGIKMTNGKIATVSKNISGTGNYYATYKSGYGSVDVAYYLRVQTSTNTSSSTQATLSGRWTP